MAAETVDTLVVGAGQAGLAMSEHLSLARVPHLVLERHRIAERWRSERWDSLVANGPAWHDRFPTRAFETEPDGFPARDSVVGYMEAYARQISAPVRCGVSVERVTAQPSRPGFRVETSEGLIEARSVVAATGPFQRPVVPPIVPDGSPIVQLHSSAYRNPESLPPGAVFVVGAGSSGAQIADELLRAGREVTLSIGPHERPPRRYRGRDYCWWLGVLGKWDLAAKSPGTEHVTISVSGAHGGETVDFRRFAARGMTLVGMADRVEDSVLHIRPGLAETIAAGDRYYMDLLDEADAFAAAEGLSLPEDPEARRLLPMPECVAAPIDALDLGAFTSIVWATGYAFDFSWVELDLFAPDGRPRHHRGVTAAPGFYFLGLPWLSRRGSSFIWGVWHDARHLADQISIQRAYFDHHAARLVQEGA
ncbi:MAG: NAD(P)/FAD-dependent oxidoreductase [Pseudomonadota bacterium]